MSDSAAEFLDTVISQVPHGIQKTIEFWPVIKLTVLLIIAALVLGVVFRFIFGKDSSMNRAMSCAIGILFIYAVSIVIHTLNPWKLMRYVSPLPFVVFHQDTIVIYPITQTVFSALCSNLLSLVILCFLVNLLDNLIPKGNSIIGWFLMRVLSVILSMFANLFVSGLLKLYLPELLVTYAPAALLLLLAVFFLLGISKIILGVILTVVNPLIGALYAFFFSNRIGKQLSKAFLSACILCGFFYLMEFFGYTVISVTAASLLSYIPFAASLLVLWYLLGHEL